MYTNTNITKYKYERTTPSAGGVPGAPLRHPQVRPRPRRQGRARRRLRSGGNMYVCMYVYIERERDIVPGPGGKGARIAGFAADSDRI